MARRNGGEVSVRFSVENAEAVRRALETLGKDGEKALRQFDAATRPVPNSLGAVTDGIAAARQQAQAWAAQLGPIGAALVRLGPQGLVAAGAIGAVALATKRMGDGAHEFARQMGEIRDIAQIVGMTTTQVQAVIDFGSQWALTEGQITSGLQRFSAQMEEFRRGQGELFQLINRIDPVLARQMAMAGDTVREIDLLGQAYQRAGTRASALSRAAFGRGGFDFGRLVAALPGEGGIAGLTDGFRRSGDAIEEHVIRRVVDLKREIDDMSADARRNFQSIFSVQFLEAQHRAAETWRDLSRWARTFSISDDLRRLIDWGTGAMPSWLSDWSLLPVLLGGAQLTQQGMTGTLGRSVSPLTRGRPISQDVDAMYGPLLAGSGGSGGDGKASAEFEAARLKAMIGALGAAVTPAEQLRLKQLELAAAVEKGAINQETATRALRAYEAALAQSDVAMRQSLGIVTEQEMLTRRLADLQDLRAKGHIRTEEEMALATRLTRREVEEAAKSMAVRVSEFPALTRLAQDAGNFASQIDQGVAGALRSAASEFSLLNNNAARFEDRLANMALKLADVVVQAMLMKNLFGPLANAASGMLGGLLGSLFPSAAGNVFAGGQVVPFASGGAFGRVVHHPSMFALGSMAEREPEAIMPLRRLASGRLGVEAAGGGRAAPTINVHNYSGAEPEVRTSPDGSIVDIIINAVDRGIAARAERGRSATGKTMRAVAMRSHYRG